MKTYPLSDAYDTRYISGGFQGYTCETQLEAMNVSFDNFCFARFDDGEGYVHFFRGEEIKLEENK